MFSVSRIKLGLLCSKRTYVPDPVATPFSSIQGRFLNLTQHGDSLPDLIREIAYIRLSPFLLSVPVKTPVLDRLKLMAKSLSNILLRGIAGFPAARSSRIACGALKHSGARYYGTVPNDPDTHEDFKPTNKFESSGISLADVVEQDVKDNPVMIYMKGVPEFPQCGFSALAVRVLKHYNVPLSARNILEDPELKSAVKAYSHWPTFPQVFIKGEFIGGSDIIMNMHQSGELKDKLKDIGDNP